MFLKKIIQQKNYRPVSVLPWVSNFFERLMHKQTGKQVYTSANLYPFTCVAIERVSVPKTVASVAQLPLIKKWKKVLDKKGYGDALLMELSKAVDTIK